MIIIRIVAGVLLLAHGFVHLLYLAPEVDEFSLEQSWLVPEPVRRPVGLVLLAATVAAFLALALAIWGAPGLSAAWPAVAVVAGVLSVLLLGLFFDPSLGFGLAIDVVVLAIAVTRPTWIEDLLR